MAIIFLLQLDLTQLLLLLIILVRHSVLRKPRYLLIDVTFGNGVFVAVGQDEKIYTSTDGDTWTKVYP